MGDITRTRVAEVVRLSSTIKSITLVSGRGDLLPGFTAGAHVVAIAREGGSRRSIPFSLAGSPFERRHWRLVVKRVPELQDHARHLFEVVGAGQRMDISGPSNGLPLAPAAARHVFLAAGVGITPFLAHLHEVQALREDFELHHVYRDEEDGVLSRELADRHGHRVRRYLSSEGEQLIPQRILASRAAGAHLYVCGPTRFVESMADQARRCGWPEYAIHYERHLRLRRPATHPDAGGRDSCPGVPFLIGT